MHRIQGSAEGGMDADVKSARGLAHSRTLRAGGSRSIRASVLECGGPPPLFKTIRVREAYPRT